MSHREEAQLELYPIASVASPSSREQQHVQSAGKYEFEAVSSKEWEIEDTVVEGKILYKNDGNVEQHQGSFFANNKVFPEAPDSLPYFHARKSTFNCSDPYRRRLIYVGVCVLVVLLAYIIAALIAQHNAMSDYDAGKFVYNYNPLLPNSGGSGSILASAKAAGYGTIDNPLRVSLLGDSLINFSWEDHELEAKLLAKLSEHSGMHVKFFNRGIGGNTVRSVLDRVPEVVEDQSTVVIIFWDSDFSNSIDAKVAPSPGINPSADYVQTLDLLLSTVTALPLVEFVAVAGPGIYGEGWKWTRPFPYSNPDINELLDIYRDVNMAATQTYGLTYIDMTRSLQSVQWGAWPLYWGWCTQDGEHFSNLGVKIQADLFSQYLLY